MLVANGQDVGRWPEAEIVHVIGDGRPAVRHAGRDDDDIANLHVALDDVVAADLAAAARAVQRGRHLGVGGRRAGVDDPAAGPHRAGARHDVVALGLLVVRNAAGAARGAGLVTALLGVGGRRRTATRGRRGGGGGSAGLAAMNDADREVLV